MIISIKKQQGLGIKIALSFSLLLLIRIDSANAQKKDTVLLRQLAPVTVTATRLEINEKRLPAALTVLSGGRIQIGQPQLSMFESLGGVAGLFAQNPDNYTQDLRISIRGFGARAAFGIRGIRLYVDGIPESTPDGQADVDNIDMGAMQRLEVMRGPSSGLFGNAAGGVISLQTDNVAQMPLAEVQGTVGSYGMRSWRFKMGVQQKNFKWYW